MLNFKAMKAGTFLKARDEGNDFDNAIIFLTEWNSQGATGFVVNKPFHRSLNELEEFKNMHSFPLYVGGPVMPEKLYFAHRKPDLIPGGIQITENIYLGGDFKQALSLINNGEITTQDIKLFIGYCGWDSGQLQEEIKEDSWQITEEPMSVVFL
jgi:putative transcriptional regulator